MLCPCPTLLGIQGVYWNMGSVAYSKMMRSDYFCHSANSKSHKPTVVTLIFTIKWLGNSDFVNNKYSISTIIRSESPIKLEELTGSQFELQLYVLASY